ncbi:hypothetical protein BD309DRAFT_979314 [Dichomitus squalens]|uniref:Uncharacterized protein n=1 Tax=Dichomitus squalens TaxID=114155 RepID=A0A4Q9NXB1_9APHY|nr:hypothetical protein BD309DRAFT_979314 [Dichomitus squalens]TBU62777.1 hypothetical protein BD310DRAFT_945637 [Dichomitus squalens]
MATPSSSATTPSPRLRYLQPAASASTSAVVPNGHLSNDSDDRETLARRITADAHLGEYSCHFSTHLTRVSIASPSRNRAIFTLQRLLSGETLALSLRARLLYANFKVKSNTANHTLHELDSQLSAAGKHTPNGKRVANHFADPGSPSSNAGGQSSRSAARKGSMAPPPPVTASAAQSLFSSLLAPPPSKRARTIHNPEDPPVPAPEKVVEQTRSPRPPKVARTPDAHAKSKSKRAAKETASAKGKGKGKQRVTAEGSFETVTSSVEDREIDMEAAATLTTLLLNQQRPSVSATAGSPRSSISAGSDPGSTHSFTQYAQSAARTAAGGSTPVPSSSQQPLFSRAPRSTATPPHSPALSQASPALSHAVARRASTTQGSSLRPEGAGTPKMTPRDRVEDTDAADLLLHMATSPSPVRPSSLRNRDARDAAAFRTLYGGGSGPKGRVLFSSASEDGRSPRTLSREMSGSFASISSTATEPVSPRTIPARANASQVPSRLSTVHDASQSSSHGHLGIPMLPTVTPPTPTDQALPHLLPAALGANQRPAVRSPGHSSQPPSDKPAPRTPNASFSLSDYMNVSPSPAAAMLPSSRTPSGLSSQAGRRLFEDHYKVNGSAAPPQLYSKPPSSPTQHASLQS